MASTTKIKQLKAALYMFLPQNQTIKGRTQRFAQPDPAGADFWFLPISSWKFALTTSYWPCECSNVF